MRAQGVAFQTRSEGRSRRLIGTIAVSVLVVGLLVSMPSVQAARARSASASPPQSSAPD
jgi:hypothetical protein